MLTWRRGHYDYPRPAGYVAEKNALQVVKVAWARQVLVGASCALKAVHTCKRRRSRNNSDSDPGPRYWVGIEYFAGDRDRMLVRCAATCAGDLVASGAAFAVARQVTA